MINLRGSNYKKAMKDCTPSLVADAKKIVEVNGKFTPFDIATLATKTGLPCKTTCEFLEHVEFLPSGTWERFRAQDQAKIRYLAKATKESVQ